jgi:uncharacterized protein
MTSNIVHRSHPDIVKRLRRAEGHLRSIIEMIESGRTCLDVAQQMSAVEKAVMQAKRTFIHDHIGRCLDDSVSANPHDQKAAVSAFREITKYL